MTDTENLKTKKTTTYTSHPPTAYFSCLYNWFMNDGKIYKTVNETVLRITSGIHTAVVYVYYEIFDVRFQVSQLYFLLVFPPRQLTLIYNVTNHKLYK